MAKDISSILEQKCFYMGSSDLIDKCTRVIVGLPMDSTTSFRPGTRLAPYRVREVSEGIEEYSIYQNRSLQEIDYYDAGDVLIPFGNIRESLHRIEAVTAFFLEQGKRIFAIGGEHLVSLPVIKAYHNIYPDLAVIQMDAHADLREEYLGEVLSHATVMRQVAEELKDKSLFQLGIRSATRDELNYAAGRTALYLDRLLDAVNEAKKHAGSRPVYISLDIDVLDPAFAPGTGTPEAGGFSSRELFQVLHSLADLNIVGFDMVEISPPYDTGDNTSILGAKILRETLLAY